MAELICSADDPRWLTERRKGITATDITTILGLNPYQSPYGLWWEKTNPDAPAREDNDRLRLGRNLEYYIFTRYCEAHPDAPVVQSHELFRNSARPWQMATLDGRYWPGPDAVVEFKSWADADRRSWDDSPPPRVRAQVLWQMDVMSVTTGHVGVLFLPSGEFRSYVIEHEHKGHVDECPACFDQALMRTNARNFLDRIDLNDPPDVDGSAATLAALRARFTRYPDKSVPVDDDLVFAWVEQKTKRDYHEARARELEAKIRVKLGEATFGTVNDIPVVRRFISDAKVKAHTRHQDYLKIIPARGADDA
jgi:putative phage-type endonuclease